MERKAVLFLIIAIILSACASKQYEGKDEILDKGPYTGLIVDARGLNLEMAMAPKIYSQSGHLVYGYLSVTDDRWLNHGMVQYVESVEKAKADLVDWVGDKPLVVKAQGAKGKKRTDVVVNDTSAVAIFASDVKDHFLEQGRVVFVIDKPHLKSSPKPLEQTAAIDSILSGDYLEFDGYGYSKNSVKAKQVAIIDSVRKFGEYLTGCEITTQKVISANKEKVNLTMSRSGTEFKFNETAIKVYSMNVTGNRESLVNKAILSIQNPKMAGQLKIEDSELVSEPFPNEWIEKLFENDNSVFRIVDTKTRKLSDGTIEFKVTVRSDTSDLRTLLNSGRIKKLDLDGIKEMAPPLIWKKMVEDESSVY